MNATNSDEKKPEAGDLIHRIASLTRMLRDSMRELGLDQAIKDAAEAIPDARDRLRYVAQMTEQAANRVLNATEAAGPIQDDMARNARELDTRWQSWFDQPLEVPEARELVKAMGGRVAVESRQGLGTRFSYSGSRLPCSSQGAASL